MSCILIRFPQSKQDLAISAQVEMGCNLLAISKAFMRKMVFLMKVGELWFSIGGF
jgi:hypothetical protein